MPISAEHLLFEIAACPNVVKIFSGTEHHPCAEIVRSQESIVLDSFQIPEPWNGRIDTARLLYMSSNPSISKTERYPTWNNSTVQSAEFFTYRFGGGSEQSVKNGKYALKQDGSHLSAQNYWSEIINRSEELYGRAVIPGIDYAMTEVVHCKSQRRIGVKSALDECSRRYLQRILEVSAASVIAVIGNEAKTKFLDIISNHSEKPKIIGPQTIAGKERIVLFLAAPGSSKPRKIANVLTTDELNLVRSYLV